ncbi:MAG: flavodoxin-dependent (E)-4-hydroxy-3-methylbut-2-enyl-diphosphate synthase [Clostridiales bacterium]|nr:flavodoxin-dependent (E)-4-hydroxy-3-methylbut-2-enyl-diphosphate synthase [Clostridiales bacterium]
MKETPDVRGRRRDMTRPVKLGRLTLGGGNPVWVQSMTNTDTRDVPATLQQIRQLADAGCDIVRVSVYDEECARAVRQLVDGSPVPLVADIHFNHRLAIMAAENGISKLRINPGNIGGEQNVRELAAVAKAHQIPIRIGVNTGSVEKEILEKYGHPCAEGLVESALKHARMLEKVGFEDIVLSMKASDVRLTIETYELAAKSCDYPLHVGVTEAGLPGQGTIKSAIGIGSLLARGIGDTIRVSLSGDPVPEAAAAWSILRALNLRTSGVQLVSCPTCGRTSIDVAGIAARVEKELADITVPLKVAVMGCVVNGPGEAREADVGIAGGKDCGALFIKGEPPRKVEGDLAAELIRVVREMAAEREG